MHSFVILLILAWLEQCTSSGSIFATPASSSHIMGIDHSTHQKSMFEDITSVCTPCGHHPAWTLEERMSASCDDNNHEKQIDNETEHGWTSLMDLRGGEYMSSDMNQNSHQGNTGFEYAFDDIMNETPMIAEQDSVADTSNGNGGHETGHTESSPSVSSQIPVQLQQPQQQQVEFNSQQSPTLHHSPTPTSSPKNQFYGNNDLSQSDKDVIFSGLRRLYNEKVLPLEIASKYSHFGSPPMSHSDFEAKPMVLIIGQYSVGKTSFIRSLVQQDFPGQRIGPEPTTDRFTAIMSPTGNNKQGPNNNQNRHAQSRLIPGHALVMQSDKPFRGLASMGNNFLSKFEGAECNTPILQNITIIDTPGVLAGEKQRLGRDYDFSEVIKWFAERADMIIVMFDAHKLDISDELKTVLDELKPHGEKLRVLLNKADTIDTQSLLRVYGALMWSLGKVVQTPEACRIYLGSFWDAPLKLQDNRILLEREKSDLLTEMKLLPSNAVIRRINELVKRARSVKVHAYIIHYLKKQMPYLVGKSEKQRMLLDRLDKEFLACARRYNLPLGDFPNVDNYRKMLAEVKDISDFKKLDKRMVYEMDKVLTHDIPVLLEKAQRSSNRRTNLGLGPRQGNGFGGTMMGGRRDGVVGQRQGPNLGPGQPRPYAHPQGQASQPYHPQS